MQTEHEMLFDLERFGDAVALVEDGVPTSYAELAADSRAIAGAAGGRALAFVLCTNTKASVAGYVGFMNAGIVPLLLEESIDEALFQDLVARYRPRLVWLPEGGKRALPGFENAFSFGGYDLLTATAADGYPLHPDLALLVSTSGSTGTPKLVRLSRRNVLSNTESIIDYLGITPRERAIASLPMSYVYGLSVLNTHLHAGASLALTEAQCYEGRFWRVFDEAACTSFAGVPFMYEMLDKLRFNRKEPPRTLRTMTQAGGRLAPALQERFALFARDHGLDFVVMYGASEATARMAYLPSERALDKPGSIGIAIPGGRFEVAGEDGESPGAPAGPGALSEGGELVYYGDNVSMGYSLSGEDLARGDERGGRLATGDVARVDSDGYYYIVGRKKRFVKMLGKRVSLDEVESIVKSRLGLTEVACGGKDDLLRLYVEDEGAADGVLRCVHEATGINGKLIEVVAVDAIPKSPSGKTLYSKLDELEPKRKDG